LWCIAYQHTKNILIVTATGDLGRQAIIDIRQFIESDEKFNEDFGDLRGNIIWTTDKIACRNKVCISTKGSEMAIRGTKIFGVRPTVIICDDILSAANSSNSDQRLKLYDWYNKVLMPAGEKYCSVFVIGTILSDACLLNLMLTDSQFSDYYTKKYKAIMNFSDSPLWDQWLNLRNDLANPGRTIDADKFYFDNREEMLEGTVVLWDRYIDSYLNLMKEKQRIGSEAFSTEYMSDGLLEENRDFKEDWLTRNFYLPEDVPVITDVWIGVDAAAKAKKTSDDSALVVLGKGTNNYLYILEAFAKKIPIEALIDQTLIYAVQYGDVLRGIRIEDVVFQILLKDLMEKKAIDSGLYLPFEAIKIQREKELRIRSLVIPMRNNYFRFSKEHRKLLEEIRRFPKGSSDNLLDAWYLAFYGVLGNANTQFSFGGIHKNTVLTLDPTKYF
jgi:phage terminase large subunit-like protein